MWKVALLCFLCLAAALGAIRLISAVVYNTSVTPHGRLPIYDHGYLIVTYSPGDPAFTVYGPSGARAFDGIVKLPHRESAYLGNPAAAADGTVALPVIYNAKSGRAGAIAIFNRIGRQIRLIDTGAYLPSAVVFHAADQLWAAGWQQAGDYFIFRRFAGNGTETGQYVHRSLFRGTLEPGHIAPGEHALQSADDRIGALLASGNAGDQREWVEFSPNGDFTGRWRMDHLFGLKIALTAGGSLYASAPAEPGKSAHLTLFDRSAGAWKAVAGDMPADWILLGAEGRQIVTWDRGSDPMLLRYLIPGP